MIAFTQPINESVIQMDVLDTLRFQGVNMSLKIAQYR